MSVYTQPIAPPTRDDEKRWDWIIPSSRGDTTYTVTFQQWFSRGDNWRYMGDEDYESRWSCTCPSRKRPCKHVLAVQQQYERSTTWSEAAASGDWEEMDIAEHSPCSANGEWVLNFRQRIDAEPQ